MKKIFGLIALMLVLACDDGDMTFQTFNFGTAAVQSCTATGIIYKTSGTQALILDLDPAAFINIETGATPRNVTLGAANRLVYRNYTGNVSSASLCSEIPPASPVVAEEWIALPGGTLNIVTTEREDDDGKLIGYSHAITLKSVTFTKGDETIIMQDNVFGTYLENLPYSFDFLDEDNNIVLGSCTDNSTTVFRVTGNESLLLSLAAGIFPGVPGESPLIDLANTTDANQVIFTTYAGSASTALFCNTPPPVLNVTGQWFATAGQLKIVTVAGTGGVGFDHVVYLVNATFTNTAGEAIVVANGSNPEYRLGSYHTD